jgi:hypothetical protein
VEKTHTKKGLFAGAFGATIFAVFAITTAFSAPVVVIPGEGAGYIYYSASSGGAAPVPVEDPSFVGMIVAFDRTPPADTWVPCHGQTIFATQYPKLVEFLAGASAASAPMPDYRGYFLRGAGTNSATGVYSAALGLRQDDATRNITGNFYFVDDNNGAIAAKGYADGAFYTSSRGTAISTDGTSSWGVTVHFDASRVVPTAHEIRPHNIAVIYAMRAK